MKANRKGEYATFVTSICLIGFILLILLQRHSDRDDGTHLTFSVKVDEGSAKTENGSVVLPVIVKNEGNATATEVTLRVAAPGQTFDVKLQYVSPKGPQKFFVTLPAGVASDQVDVSPLYYLRD